MKQIHARITLAYLGPEGLLYFLSYSHSLVIFFAELDSLVKMTSSYLISDVIRVEVIEMVGIYQEVLRKM